MSSEWGDEVLRHKYDPLPEDAPRHRKKSKKRHVRSDHRHEYEKVCIDAHMHAYTRRDGRYHFYNTAKRCKVCGRIANVSFGTDVREPPEGMRLFEVSDWCALFEMKLLPDEMEVKYG